MKIKPIHTEEDYNAALARIKALWNAEPGTDNHDELEILGILVDVYEQENLAIENKTEVKKKQESVI